MARADLEAAKAPRRLLERWSEVRDDEAPAPPPTAPTLEPERRAAAPDVVPAPEPDPEPAPVEPPAPDEGDAR